MSYDDPVSADEVVRSIAAGARAGMAQVMQLGAHALRVVATGQSLPVFITYANPVLSIWRVWPQVRFRVNPVTKTQNFCQCVAVETVRLNEFALRAQWHQQTK